MKPVKSSAEAAARRPRKLTGSAAPESAAARRDDDPQYIGRNLRHARLVAGLTLRDLADRVGCSESLLSKIENDRASPSLQMLHRLVTQLGTSIGMLFSDPAARPRTIMRRGERPTLRTSHPQRQGQGTGVSLEWLVPYPEGKLLSGSIHKIAPGGGSQGAIMHKGEEMGYVLQGRLSLTLGEQTHELEEGDSFFFPSETPHGYSNPGEVETWVLWVNTPPTF